MPKSELPSCLRPPAEATDQQIDAYMVELCEELRIAINDPRFRQHLQDTAKLEKVLEEIQVEARRHAETADPPQD